MFSVNIINQLIELSSKFYDYRDISKNHSHVYESHGLTVLEKSPNYHDDLILIINLLKKNRGYLEDKEILHANLFKEKDNEFTKAFNIIKANKNMNVLCVYSLFSLEVYFKESENDRIAFRNHNEVNFNGNDVMIDLSKYTMLCMFKKIDIANSIKENPNKDKSKQLFNNFCLEMKTIINSEKKQYLDDEQAQGVALKNFTYKSSLNILKEEGNESEEESLMPSSFEYNSGGKGVVRK